LSDHKHCPDCGESKPKGSFYKNKARHDGLQSICKNCSGLRNSTWYIDNKESHNQYMREHSKKNRPMYNIRDSNRRASELNATPPWANKEQIARIYKLCKKVSDKTGVQHHVDHVVPLRGSTVCGLHVENNLAIIPAKDNLTKGNRWDSEPRSSTKEEPEEDEVE
jgi:hypothetical protein